MEKMNNRESSLLTKSEPTEGTSWSTTDRLQLLAYLEWCVQYCVNFEGTAPGYLEKATGKHFSKEHIRKKLYREWTSYGVCPEFNDLFDLGTSGLLPLVDNEQECFHQIVTSIDPAEEVPCTPGRPLGIAARSGALSKPHSIGSIGTSRESNELSTPQAGNSNVIPERPRKKSKARLSVGPTRQTSRTDLDENKFGSDDSTDIIQSEDESVPRSIASPELSDIELQLAPVIPDSPKENVTIISRAQSTSSTGARLRQSEADLLKQKSYVITLENRISELERINHSKHCICPTSSAHEEEAQLRNSIFSLKDRLRGERVLTTSHENLEVDRLGFLNTSLENVFPTFLAADSPLLDQYRKHIEALWGRDALQRLDVVSIKSLISDRNVKNGMILDRSNRVSSLMLESLSCFLPLESRDMTKRSSHNYSETEIINDLRSTLYHAMRFKLELMLSIKRLKYLFFKPGMLFDRNKMEVVKSQAGDTALLGQKVRICLVPALFAISEAADEVGVEEEASLSASSSKALAEVTDEDVESLVLVEKAIVFL